ncbi:MAG: FAD-binding oxidoreductase [Acetivibrionales bacterium]
MDAIRERLVAILGKENVSDDPEILESFAGDRSFATPLKPWFVVKPVNAAQVQELVKYANEVKMPLVPVSSGSPRFRGDTVPGAPQSIIVDLRGMKKILSINRRHRMAVVEPGVTYEELLPALAKEGMTLSMPLAPKPDKSVVASVLEVEPRLNSLHQWNYTDPLRCVEVIWGDGNRMFTGEAGGGPLDLQKQQSAEKWQVNYAGPMMLDFYRLLTAAQGSMGIVTWASLRCEVLPQIHKLYIVPADKPEDLIDFVYRVIRLRFSDELLVMNNACLAYLLGDSQDQIRRLQAELPSWVALVGIVGRELLPEMRVEAQEKDVEEIAQQFGLKFLPTVPGANGEEVLEKLINPSVGKYWKESCKGAFQDIFFVTTLDRTPGFINAMNSLATAARYPAADIGVYIQPQHMGSSYHCEFIIPYNPDDAMETSRVRELYVKASEEFSGMGAYYARPYNIWARLQINKDAQSAIILRKLKDIFDPNGIMNPGKVSI